MGKGGGVLGMAIMMWCDVTWLENVPIIKIIAKSYDQRRLQ